MPANSARDQAEPDKRGKPLVFSKRAVTLTKRMGEDTRDPDVVWDVWCGLHSGIPECCITFFVKVWRHLNRGRWENEVLGEPSTGDEDEVIDVLNIEVVELVDSIQYGYLDLIRSYKSKRARSSKAVVPWYIVCPACLLTDNIVRLRRCRCRQGGKPPAFPL
jgi:hypothetical protein